MANRGKSFVWQQPMLLALLAAVGSFGLGLIMTIGTSHQLLPRRQAEQGQTGTSQTMGVEESAKQQVEALKSAMLISWEQDAKARNLIVSIPKQFQATTFNDVKLSGPGKVIALTFDDGPWPKTTEQVLEILKQQNIKATFFWVGEMVQNYPQIAQKVIADGHAIGNHTWHHWFRKMNETTAASEINRTAAIIYKTTGVETSLFRPPGGILNNGVAEYAKKNKYGVAMWSADSVDYRRPSVPSLIHNVLRNAQPGGIVLMHDGGGNRSNTVQALPQIIDILRKRGYAFVTLPQLLEIQDKGRGVKMAARGGV